MNEILVLNLYLAKFSS